MLFRSESKTFPESESETFDFTIPTTFSGSLVQNTASASGTIRIGKDTFPVDAAPYTVETKVLQPSVKIEKLVDGEAMKTIDYTTTAEVTYSFTVTNIGETDLEGVTITDANLEMEPIVIGTLTKGDSETATVTISLADLMAKPAWIREDWTFKNTASVTANGVYEGSTLPVSAVSADVTLKVLKPAATILKTIDFSTASEGEGYPQSEVFFVDGDSAVVPDKNVYAYEGDTVFFAVTIENTGELLEAHQAPLTGVMLEDALLGFTDPDGLHAVDPFNTLYVWNQYTEESPLPGYTVPVGAPDLVENTAVLHTNELAPIEDSEIGRAHV